MSTVHAHVVVGPEGGHRMRVAGVTALERCLWGLKKRGFLTAVIAAEPFALRADLPIQVAWVASGTPPADDVEVVRGDEVAGIAVRDRASARAAEVELLRGLGKSYQGITDALINQHLSRPITDLLKESPVTPNQITCVSIAVGLAGAALLLQGSYAGLALGGVALQVQSVLDSCDGELARLRFQYSTFGQWLDNVGDDVVDNTFLACAGLAAGGVWACVGVTAAVLRLLAATAMFLEVYRDTGTGDVYRFRLWFERDKQTIDEVFDPRSPATWLRNVGRRDTYAFGWMCLCLLALPQLVVVWGGALGVVVFVTVAIHTWKRLRGQLPPLGRP